MNSLHLEKIEGDVKRVEKMLSRLDGFYIPSISSMVLISDYAKKLVELAQVVIPMVNGQDSGILAFYMNDINSKTAFITSIGLLPEYHGKGLAFMMLEFLESECKKNKFKYLQLEVHHTNTSAIELYKKFGFEAGEDKDLFILMKKLISFDA